MYTLAWNILGFFAILINGNNYALERSFAIKSRDRNTSHIANPIVKNEVTKIAKIVLVSAFKN